MLAGNRLLFAAAVFAQSPEFSAAAATPLAFGAYVPGASEHPRLIDGFARQAGRRPAIVLSYKDWSSLPFSSTELDAIWRRGAVPRSPGNRGPRAAAVFPCVRSPRDASIATCGGPPGRRRTGGKPLFVRFAHEMNGNWYPWGRGVDGNTPRDFRKPEARRRSLPLSRRHQRQVGVVAQRGLRRQLSVRSALPG